MVCYVICMNTFKDDDDIDSFQYEEFKKNKFENVNQQKKHVDPKINNMAQQQQQQQHRWISPYAGFEFNYKRNGIHSGTQDQLFDDIANSLGENIVNLPHFQQQQIKRTQQQQQQNGGLNYYGREIYGGNDKKQNQKNNENDESNDGSNYNNNKAKKSENRYLNKEKQSMLEELLDYFEMGFKDRYLKKEELLKYKETVDGQLFGDDMFLLSPQIGFNWVAYGTQLADTPKNDKWWSLYHKYERKKQSGMSILGCEAFPMQLAPGESREFVVNLEYYIDTSKIERDLLVKTSHGYAAPDSRVCKKKNRFFLFYF